MQKSDGLKIALIGTRGIPAAYGGFETFAEELSVRLAARGHEVTVYGRRPFFQPQSVASDYRGVKVRQVPTVMKKYLETPINSAWALCDAAFRSFDVVLLCNAANSPFAWIPRLRRQPVLINVDGIERRRRKWNALGRLWYRIGERASVLFASRIVADAQVIADYYQERYGAKATVIAYGAEEKRREPGAVLARFGLAAGRYLLYVSRLEPENNALGVVTAFNRVATDYKLAVVGDAPYAADYIKLVKKTAGPKVVFTGFQFGAAYEELRSNCALYIQATEVGGTHPALVEALAYGNCIVANDTPEHREVLGTAGRYYDFNDFNQLSLVLGNLLNNPEQALALAQAARRRAAQQYSWDVIVERYEQLLLAAVTGP